eukprot:m.67364 g.67364  ORF g.67364 m.67364 type:complete len:194 (-) comp13827_c0_seq2:19-600(-)
MAARGNEEDLLLFGGALPQQNVEPHAAVLVVGSSQSGKQALAHELLASAEQHQFAMQLRIANNLPLPVDPLRPRVDLVVLVLDATSRDSWTTVTQAFEVLDPMFVACGRVCIVISGAEDAAKVSVATEEIEKLADLYDCPILYANLVAEGATRRCAGRLFRLARTANGNTPHVSALCLQSLQQATTPQTALAQ